MKEEVKGIGSSNLLKEVAVAILAEVRPQMNGRADITTAQVGESIEKDKYVSPGPERIR